MTYIWHIYDISSIICFLEPPPICLFFYTCQLTRPTSATLVLDSLPFPCFFPLRFIFFYFSYFFSICSHFLLPVIYLLFSLSLLIPLPPPPPHLLSCPSNLGSAHCRIRCIGLARPQGPSLSPFYNSFYDLVFLCDLNYHAFKWLGRQRVALLICYLSFCSFCRLDEWSDTPRL